MKLVIAGGGTGGHLYPGIAVAEEVVRRGGDVLFVGTSRGLETRVVPRAGYALETLEVSGLAGLGFVDKLRGLGRLPVAAARSLAILRRYRPDAVLGVGGYASGPMVLTAALARVPTAISEQNSVPGFTNRALGHFARRIFCAFDEAAGWFPIGKVRMTGNPVRRGFLEMAGAANAVATASAAAGAKTAGDAAESSLLVVGGSQGARAVNDLVVGAAAILIGRGELPRVVHQSGESDHDRIVAAYRGLGVGDRLAVAAFIEDMVSAYRDADLVIARAGALTLAELAIMGRPAILIPLPTAADDHQSKNAAAFASAGAAVVVPQAEATAQGLADAIASLLGDHPRRAAMAQAMSRLGRPDATRMIVDDLEILTGQERDGPD
jgi:UDP-N-acetylglucosamine--N-acetylmuramyl-(pentapeptide) pyrophosphoryl-undecaprenol N-acetylglucosamine transferase